MYLYKQLTRELLKNKIFIFLLLILSVFTTFMYFFVHFSIDGNMQVLNALTTLRENQLLYLNALNSNILLARNFLVVLTGLTSFVFGMFFYRFYKTNGKQIGCLRSLGFKNNIVRSYFVSFTVILSLVGATIGILTGYFASDILINANIKSYSVSDIVKSINLSSAVIGFFVPTTIFSIVTFFSYGFVAKKEAGNLISGVNNGKGFSWTLKLAHNLTKILPSKHRFPLRIALRKPISILMIVTAVMGFTVMFVMGYSLNLSSEKVFNSQTVGHKYLFDTYFDEYKIENEKETDVLYYLSIEGIVKSQTGRELNQQIIGIEQNQQIIGIEQNDIILALENTKGEWLTTPKNGAIYICPVLSEIYGIEIGDKVTLTIDNMNCVVMVEDIATNAKLDSIYISKTYLSEILNLPSNTFNGVLSMEKLFGNEGTTITSEQKIDDLDRASVSNRSSAIINQSIGCIVGCILIYLAVLLNFQDSIKDILILHLMGYKPKAIRKLLIDVYRPIIWLSFLLTLVPSIITSQSVQKSLSIQTGDYMPFQTSFLLIIFIFILLNALYYLVQITFNFGIKKIINKESIADYVYAN